MNRLLQGDVGSGKTIVALMAARRGDGERLPGRLHGADRDPCRAALHHDPPAAGVVALPDRAADRLDAGAASGARRRPSSRPGRCTWWSAPTRWSQDPIGFRELGLVIIDEQHRFGVMQRATLRAKGRASRRAGDDRHADPAHARADDLRRPRRLDDARDAAGPAADHDARRSPSRGATRSTTSSASRSTPGGRPTSSTRWSRSPRKSTSRPPREMADHLAQDVFPAYRVGAAARPHEAGRQGARDGSLRARRDRRAGLDHGRRGRRRRAQRIGDARRARRAVRPLAAAPAPRAGSGAARTRRSASCCTSRR